MKVLNLLITVFITVLLFSCNNKDYNNKKQSIEKYWETLDSSGFSVYLGGTIKKQQIFTNAKRSRWFGSIFA